MNAILLILGVAGATGFWVVNRWAARSGARTAAYTFRLLLFSTILSGLVALGNGGLGAADNVVLGS